ncbi:hypothetical protein niasHT_008225 [Heterodera trifolii]|uniref:Uncharacterized protein n=1 Tax=Heterodera trifolii TaxID=157864 RepID=A0ABD2LUF5_9BILA
MSDMKPLRLRRPSIVSTSRSGLGDLGVPLTRHLSIEPPANLADALGMHTPNWAFYHYSSPNYRSAWPWRMFRDRFDCEQIVYNKHFSVQPIYRNVPLNVPSHRTNFSNHQSAGYWSFDYDYMHELPPKRLFSVFDPFDDEYKHWNKYGSRRMDERLNQHKCSIIQPNRHYFA